jgi:hypothetical protein
MTALDISFERLFSMPAFEGPRILRVHKNGHPTLSITELIQLVVKVEPDPYSLDLEAAAKLLTLIEPSLPNEGAFFYRGCLSAVLLEHHPIWLRILVQGRKRFLQKLGRDEYSLFRQAQLLDDEPDDDVVEWWDIVNGQVRLEGDREKMQRARRAERLTIEREKKRLKPIFYSSGLGA